MPSLHYPATRARVGLDVRALYNSMSVLMAMASIKRDDEISEVPQTWMVDRRLRDKDIANGVPFEDQGVYRSSDG